MSTKMRTEEKIKLLAELFILLMTNLLPLSHALLTSTLHLKLCICGLHNHREFARFIEPIYLFAKYDFSEMIGS